MRKMPRVLVCQHGARHRYAVPRMLEEAGMLSALYTDSSSASFLGRVSCALGPLTSLSMQRLANRRIDSISAKKVFSSDKQYFGELVQRVTGRLPTGMRLYHQRHQILSKKMMEWGLRDANVVYSMYHENLAFTRWAKQRGAKSVVDVFINPETIKIMQREAAKFSDWGEKQDQQVADLEDRLWQDTAELADVLLCPSEWVAEGVCRLSPEAASKIRMVPYGCSIDYADCINKPVKGRILFAGGDALRKGLHYLGEAASVLKTKIPAMDMRVAGSLPEKVVHHPVCRDLNFLGKLTSEQMKDEYLSADVFVLPALSEGFAGVIAEAIGAGCPVIVTKEAGSPIIHEREGLVVPSRNTDNLAKAIDRMLTDRDLRNGCAKRALDQRPFYSEESWQSRLVEVIGSLEL